MEVVTNRFTIIKTHVDREPREPDFELVTEEIPLPLEPMDVLVKILYVSVDPYQINRMKSQSSSQKATKTSGGIAPGQAIDTHGIGKVIASANPAFEKDDLVTGRLIWGEYTIVKQGAMLDKLDTMGLPLSYHLGVLGVASGGFTAYLGFFEMCKPKKGDRVFVSAASGSVGSIAGQYAKLHGCYVVGCAGSKKKVDLVKEKLGFDDAFNYKDEADLKLTLQRYFPDGIDIYFDNVGGEMLEAAVANMSNFGRIASCGAISEYTNNGRRAALNMLDVIYKRITIRGYIIPDHMSLYDEFHSKTSELIRTGKLVVLEDISYGLESVPAAFTGLFRGDNVGKKVVCISKD